MPSSGMGSQYHSISMSGMMLFQQGPITTGMGSVVVDLASAPIEPGEYQLEIRTRMGSVEIYLPGYVQFVIDGSSLMGSREVHSGLSWWKQLTHNIRSAVSLPDQVPDYIANPPTDGRVTIRFIISTGMGSVDIYRI